MDCFNLLLLFFRLEHWTTLNRTVFICEAQIKLALSYKILVNELDIAIQLETHICFLQHSKPLPIIGNDCCLWSQYHRCGNNISFRESSKFELVISSHRFRWMFPVCFMYVLTLLGKLGFMLPKEPNMIWLREIDHSFNMVELLEFYGFKVFVGKSSSVYVNNFERKYDITFSK